MLITVMRIFLHMLVTLILFPHSTTVFSLFFITFLDRFGDDLTEEVLQYLSLKDKIRLECVSKQWQRCVYIKHFNIDVRFIQEKLPNYIYFKRRPFVGQHLESLLKKCSNIRRVDINMDVVYKSNVLSLIGRYCPHIKSLTYYSDYNDENVLLFFQSYGHKLEELNLFRYSKQLEQILRLCPNLNKVRLPGNSQFPDDKEFLPKIQHIINEKGPNTDININNMVLLSSKYSQTMKTMDIFIVNVIAEELKTGIECIARFENLKELKLLLHTGMITEPIDDCLSLIGQKCNKLLKLDLKINSNSGISDQFFASFSEFKAIKKLKIGSNELSGSVECFKHCKQLIELDITYNKLKEDFFANIASFVPKLKTLRIESRYDFSESFIDLFQTMKNIQSISYSVFEGKILIYHKIFYTKYWSFGERLSEVIGLVFELISKAKVKTITNE